MPGAKQREYQTGFYAEYAGVRDEEIRRAKAGKIRRALAGVLDQDSARAGVCVDVGCASGVITAGLAGLFALTVGLEYDLEPLRHVPAPDGGPLSFLRGDAMRLPIASASVDCVICAQVYEHVPDDVWLIAEIDRVLKPGGIVFFSGPNWLFPMEPHYHLPFLHWLPPRWADAYLRLLGRGQRYYERSRTYWGLRRLWARFEIRDVAADLLASQADPTIGGRWAALAGRMPPGLWRPLLPLLPNFNWILTKPNRPARPIKLPDHSQFAVSDRQPDPARPRDEEI